MEHKNLFEDLPSCAVEYIKLIIKKMKWRKKVREDVQAELIAHFEDALHDCKTNDEKEKAAKELIANFGDAELIATLARRAKKRCRPMWQKAIIHCFQALGILIICLILYCFYISSGKPTLRVNYTQEYLNANRPTADSNANANILYSKIAKVYVEPSKLSTDKKLPNNDCGSGSSDLISRLNETHSLNELTDEEFAAANKWVDDNNETIRLFVDASKRPYCWNEQESNLKDSSFFALLLPNLSDIRNAAKLSASKAKLDAYQGNLDGACQNIFSIWNSAGHLLGPRTIVEQLVGVAIEITSFRTTRDLLTEYKFTPQQLKLLQNNLEQLMAKKYSINYQTERFFKDDFIQRCFTDNGKGNGHAIPSDMLQSLYEINYDTTKTSEHKYLQHFKFVAISAISADRKDFSELIDSFYDTAQQYALTTPWQLRQENKSLDSLLNSWSRFKKIRYMNAMTILPAFDKVNLLFHRYNIDGQSLVSTLAVLRYQQDNKKLPESLQQLKDAGYIAEIPIDPFSGKEIIYKLTKDGFTIYSFGLDMDDDGGKMGVREKGKPYMWSDNGDAVFWPVGH
ncbi:MAG: hypothetical protein LLF92_12665 [Planctomycetaceae bacterium]|nr:hypothetical protein [Planctomycetaceae bacterium]